jgi:anti-anti-sigma regulatory factor
LSQPCLSVSRRLDGAFVLVGELDMNTLAEAREPIDEFLVPGRAVVLDLAGIRFLDSMTLHWLVELSGATGEPVVVRNAPDAVRIVLGIAGLLAPDGGAWVLEDMDPPARSGEIGSERMVGVRRRTIGAR